MGEPDDDLENFRKKSEELLDARRLAELEEPVRKASPGERFEIKSTDELKRRPDITAQRRLSAGYARIPAVAPNTT